MVKQGLWSEVSSRLNISAAHCVDTRHIFAVWDVWEVGGPRYEEARLTGRRRENKCRLQQGVLLWSAVMQIPSN